MNTRVPWVATATAAEALRCFISVLWSCLPAFADTNMTPSEYFGVPLTRAATGISSTPVRIAPAPRPAPLVRHGNICIKDTAGKIVQLTSSGKDRAPKLSPDGQCVAFIRKSKNRAYLPVVDENARGDKGLADQIWVVDTRTGKERLLVEDRMPGNGDITEELQRTISLIHDDSLWFSPDSERLYFISDAWVTSGALHVVDVRSGQERFVVGANSVEVVMSGKYVGDLIVSQHRYFLGNGSFNWYWLMDPEGREIGPIGENDDQVKAFKDLYR